MMMADALYLTESTARRLQLIPQVAEPLDFCLSVDTPALAFIFHFDSLPVIRDAILPAQIGLWLDARVKDEQAILDFQ